MTDPRVRECVKYILGMLPAYRPGASAAEDLAVVQNTLIAVRMKAYEMRDILDKESNGARNEERLATAVPQEQGL